MRAEGGSCGTEPALAADARESFRRGERVAWPAADVQRTIADALRVERVGALPFAHIRELVTDIITVTQDEMLSAVGRLARQARLIAEPAGLRRSRRASSVLVSCRRPRHRSRYCPAATSTPGCWSASSHRTRVDHFSCRGSSFRILGADTGRPGQVVRYAVGHPALAAWLAARGSLVPAIVLSAAIAVACLCTGRFDGAVLAAAAVPAAVGLNDGLFKPRSTGPI
jgi:hypothetical protein